MPTLPTSLPLDQRLPGLATHNVVWDQPSTDARGSMPLGNGELAINAWVEADGDLQFYLGTTDAWDEHGRLLKLGLVRVALTPNPFVRGQRFRQTLDLEAGEIIITAGERPVEVRLRVDAHHPAIEVTVTAEQPIAAAASFSTWRTAPMTLPSIECSDVFNRHPTGQTTTVAPDTILTGLAEGLGWYHRNEVSIGPDLTMRHQDLLEAPWKDPLIHRVSGALISAPGATRTDDQHLTLAPARQHRLTVHARSVQPATVEQWLAAVRTDLARWTAIPTEERRAKHLAWWAAFWNRSHLAIRDRAPAADTTGTRPHLRFGCGPRDSSTFPGTIARVVLLPRAVAPTDLNGVLPTDARVWDAPARGLASGDARLGQGPWSVLLDLRMPPRDEGSMLLHQRTADLADGVVIDTVPGLPTPPGGALRCAVGDRVWITPRVLVPEREHAVLVTSEGDGLRVWIDGQEQPLTAAASATPGQDVALGYTLQRFITACAGRGAYPIKFNGSLFTVGWPGRPADADYRRWGPGYWWQNSRLPYLSACAAGDTDLMDPLFRMYDEVLAVCRHRTRRYFGIDGAYLPECVYPWGAVFMESYGWDVPAAERSDKLQVSGYHKREWVAGLELAFMMLDRYEHTLDADFLERLVLPTARAVLRFFDNFYPRGTDGRLDMQPAQALEMWWDVVDPAPEIGGLQAVTDGLLALPGDRLPAEDRRWLEDFRQRIPALPEHDQEGVRMLAPARVIRSPKKNVEAPELYAVFPFRRIAAGQPGADLAVAALDHRLDRGCYGWRQDDLFMACLGLTRQARAGVVSRARQRNECRFPAFWGPNYDWTPDQDHGGVLMRTAQVMLMQTHGRRIVLLPAWPTEWDADFTLHAPMQTVVSGSVRGGKLVALQVTPAERLADVEIRDPA